MILDKNLNYLITAFHGNDKILKEVQFKLFSQGYTWNVRDKLQIQKGLGLVTAERTMRMRQSHSDADLEHFLVRDEGYIYLTADEFLSTNKSISYFLKEK